ncbi:MAG: hypothetical protein ACI9CE_003600 [Flavobacterium sp.]|jgi:hypothetical protein
MSYILDALNKSEQERQTKQSPSINSQYRIPLASQKSAQYWMIILIVLVCVNATGLYYWLTKTDDIARQQELEKPAVVQSMPTAISNTPSISKAARKLPFTELPAAIKNLLPDLSFSTHLYGEDKSFSIVNINGKMLKEGDRISEGLSLKEITQDGVVLHYQEYLIEINILSNWRAN